MAYKFKSNLLVIDNDVNRIIPRSLPETPIVGSFGIDAADNRFKVYTGLEESTKWIPLCALSVQKNGTDQLDNIEILNLVGNVSITNDDNGKITITVLNEGIVASLFNRTFGRHFSCGNCWL